MGQWTLPTYIGGGYLTLLVACLIVFAVRGKDPNSTTLDTIDYIGMIVLSPIYIVVQSCKWMYHNYPWLIQTIIAKVANAFKVILDCARNVLNRFISFVYRFLLKFVQNFI